MSRHQKSFPRLLLGGCSLLLLAGCSTSATVPSTPTATPTPTTTSTTAPPPKPKVTKPPAPVKPIYLTFDDGPSPYTPQVLDILRRKGAVATFYELGPAIQKYPQYSKAITEQGSTVQIHGWRHADLTLLSNKGIQRELNTTRDAIVKATGRKPTCVRPPYGSHSKRVDQTLRAAGYRVSMWSADSQDWQRPGVKTIVRNVMKDVKPNGIILFHDGGGGRSQTLEALPQVIDQLKAQGYTFKVLCQ